MSTSFRTAMRPRDPAEEYRAATPLELLFDLVFVVASAFLPEALPIAAGLTALTVLSVSIRRRGEALTSTRAGPGRVMVEVHRPRSPGPTHINVKPSEDMP